MRKKIILGLIFLFFIFIILISFGTSHTGLFHLTKNLDNDYEDEDQEIEKIKKEKWKLIGSVKINSGKVSELGT